jgi:peroxiredoxin
VLEGLDVALAERVLHEVGRSFLDFRVVAQRQAEQQAELAGTPEVLVAVPQLDQDIADLAGLLRLGEQLWT